MRRVSRSLALTIVLLAGLGANVGAAPKTTKSGGLLSTASGATPTPVLTSKANEQLPSATDEYLVWSQNTRTHPRHITYARPTGQPKFRVNAADTIGWGGGIEGTTLIYQQVALPGGRSDLKLFDLATRVRSSLPAAVNTKRWEWKPSISGDWILFGRNNLNQARDEWQRVLLFNTSTSEIRKLDEVQGHRAYNQPGQVNGDYATWERCSPGYDACNAYVHEVVSATTTLVPNPDLQQYAPSVTPDGTVYFARTGTHTGWRCGASTRLVRYPPGGPGTVIAQLPPGRDAFNTYAVANSDTSVTLYFDRINCSTHAWDVYRIDGAESASPEISRVEPLGGDRPGSGPSVEQRVRACSQTIRVRPAHCVSAV
jgi:hypothetical protein